jgi:hypothetical protein
MMKTTTQPKVDHTPAELDETSRILLRAAAILEERGHAKTGTGYGPNGEVCAMCAIKEATHGKWFDIDAENRLRESIGSNNITEWNNSHSAADVAAKLRAAALGL